VRCAARARGVSTPRGSLTRQRHADALLVGGGALAAEPVRGPVLAVSEVNTITVLAAIFGLLRSVRRTRPMLAVDVVLDLHVEVGGS